MNAYLAEVVKKQRADAEFRRARSIAVNLLRKGKMTLEDIAECSGVALVEVMRLARMLEGLSN